MNMDEKQELLEIYKLHAELADSVSKQRGTANRFYMLVLLGLVVLFSAFLQRKKRCPARMVNGRFGNIRHAFGIGMVYCDPLFSPTEFR